MNVGAHFRKITHHKMLVMKYCFRVGLYKQGLLHDLSKYSWTEFHIGCKYYQGTRSPNNAEREEKGVSLAWLHHKGRNKHHYEYWIDYGLGEDQGRMVGMEMPVRYVVEMFLDRVAASRNYAGDTYTDDAPLLYYQKGGAGYMMHKKTAALLEHLLEMLAEKGEEETLRYIKYKVLPESKAVSKKKSIPDK